MEIMDKGLTAPKWLLINQSEIPKMPKFYLLNLSAQAQKIWVLMKKGSRHHWASIFRALT